MTIPNVKGLEYSIQQILPQVYDDSLSYYELLNKVVVKLNEVIEQNNVFWGTDLQVFVGEILAGWLDDGTIEGMIGNTIGYMEDMFIDVKKFGVKGDGVTNDTVAINTAIASVPEGTTLLFPSGTYVVTSSITINKKIHLLGKKPSYLGGNLVKGTVLKGGGLFISAGDGMTVTGMGVQNPTGANGFEILGTSTDVTFEDCMAIARDHGYLIQSYYGVVRHIKLNRCHAYDSIHGFISKAEMVSFTDCYARNCSTMGFGIISDNIPDPNQKGEAISNKLVNCIADTCTRGMMMYRRDYYSESNANNIRNYGHSITNFIGKDCDRYMDISDVLPAPTGRTYLAVEKVTVQGGNDNSSGGDFSVVIQQGKNLMIDGLTHTKAHYVNSGLVENLMLKTVSENGDTSGHFDMMNLPAGVTPSVKQGAGLFQSNNNGIITNFLNGREEKPITIVFKDAGTRILNGGNFVLYKAEYSGVGAYLVLKYQDGKWFQLQGYTALP